MTGASTVTGMVAMDRESPSFTKTQIKEPIIGTKQVTKKSLDAKDNHSDGQTQESKLLSSMSTKCLSSLGETQKLIRESSSAKKRPVEIAGRKETPPVKNHEASNCATSNDNNCSIGSDDCDPGSGRSQQPVHRYDVMAGYISRQGTPVSLTHIDSLFAAASAGMVAVWLALLALVYGLTPRRHFRRLNEVEFNTAVLCGSVLLVTLLTRCTPAVTHWLNSVRGGRRPFSGVMVAAITVQVIAMSTDFLMAFFPLPVLVDPITGRGVYMTRLCEWTPLAFLMTLLTEGIDAREEPCSSEKTAERCTSLFRNGKGRAVASTSKMKIPLLLSAAQGLSTVCGFVLPLCPGVKSWVATMTVSCGLFVLIYPRLYVKWRRFLSHPMNLMREKNSGGKDCEHTATTTEEEGFDRVRFSYQLMAACTVIWTVFVAEYFIAWIGPNLAPPGSFLADQSESLNFIFEAIFEVLSKVVYLHLILDVHRNVFDEGARAERRLLELRRMMSVVWQCSSDAIAISVKGLDGTVTTMVSPTILTLGGDIDEKDIPEDLTGVIFEQVPSDFARSPSTTTTTAMTTSGCSRGESSEGHRSLELKAREKNGATSQSCHDSSSTNALASGSIDYWTVDVAGGHRVQIGDPKLRAATARAVASMRKLQVNAWLANPTEKILTQDLSIGCCPDAGDAPLRCEATLTRLEPNALVSVVRDISQRYLRFEAEKKAVSEMTARKKDAQANRFTRHEVKNGLLAAMALCDSLKESSPIEMSSGGESDEMAGGVSTNKKMRGQRIGPSSNDLYRLGVTGGITELESTLREVLDTVLSEALARDVVHEIYEPKMERVDLPSLLCSTRSYDKSSMDRFPLVTRPSPLPMFILDPQLIRYIHRNAVSNACKYGKRGGVVRTELRYHAECGELEMNVINLPGDDHADLIMLGGAGPRGVFEPGKRLHGPTPNLMNCASTQSNSESDSESHSSGDGAWISSKCAKTFGGDCSIRFEEDQTVFTLRIPAITFKLSRRRSSVIGNDSDFKLPGDTWGIAVDDSNIQRKLMHKFFSLVGIPENQQVVLGKDADEIIRFNEIVATIIEETPNSPFLLIADENLDVVEDATHHHTVSGSKSVEKLRDQLAPHDEKRMLALVRSANDSAADVATYKKRAHGFFPKAPIRREKILDMLEPLWSERFPDMLVASEEDEDDSPDSDFFLPDVNDDVFVSSAADLAQTLEVIDALVLQNSAAIATRWPILREKLHSLSGDLMTLQRSQLVSDVLTAIEPFRCPLPPENFVASWMVIRLVIMNVIRSHDC